ncbi:MAG TPA: glycoside hydrolase family 76 protein [Polyangiaceae bacterium]
MHVRLLAALPLVALVAACSAAGSSSATAPDAGEAAPDAGDPDSAGGVPRDAGAPSDAHASDAASTDAGADGPADAAPPADLGPGGDFRAYADGVAAALQAMYDPSTGLFPSTGWWNSANALTALIDYSARTKSTTYASDIATTFDRNDGAHFLDSYYDDEGWWALAWIDAYDLTHEGRYLSMAGTIFADMTGGWDSTCKGGIWWSKSRTYKNAIANELFFLVAVRLHERVTEDGGPRTYLDWAKREWAWFDASGMIGAQSLVNDGLDSSCKNNGQTTWTYNQGVLFGALVDLAEVEGDATLLARAQTIGDAAMKHLVDDVGVLREPCEPSCGGDGPQFKGIFMRHLAELAAATGAARDIAFLTTNADWIWNAARGSGDQVGLGWSQAFDSADGARQGSALDALNATIPYAAPQSNEALSKSAAASGSCATDQTAAQAFDGKVTTKWCSGATSTGYWLDVDLGSVAAVGRIIVRHAGAGGESTAWNTRDFSLSASDDDKTWTPLASVTGNTRDVTIHRFASTQARYVRMGITAPQTDPKTVAARIDELEVYGR